MPNYDKVETALEKAKGIAWDTCHKIYVLLDDEQLSLIRRYEYEVIISADEMNPEQMLKMIKTWYADSCDLRFVQSIITSYDYDLFDGYEDLIPQFADEIEDN